VEPTREQWYQRRIAELEAQVVDLKAQVARLAEQVAKLLKDSSNSSKPPSSGIARSRGDARDIARRVGYPVLVRPSYVLGGRGMKVCNNDADLDEFLQTAFAAGDRIGGAEENPILIDKFLVDAIALDVDAVADYGGEPSEQSRDRKGADSDAAEAPLCHAERPHCHAERSEASPTRRASAQPEILRSAQNDKSMCMVAGIMEHIEETGIPTTLVSKHSDAGGAPFLKDLIDDGTLQPLINTPIHTGPASAEGRWRAAATARRVPLITTLAGARAAVSAIRALSKSEDGHEPTPLAVKPLQSYFASQET